MMEQGFSRSFSQSFSRNFSKKIDSLSAIYDFASGFISEHKIPATHAYTIQLSLEEVFTNMVKYNSESDNEPLIELDKKGPQVILRLTDYDVHEFDIRQAGNVDTERPAAETPVGGLGIHLIKKLVDQIDYDYQDRNSVVTLSLNVEKNHA